MTLMLRHSLRELSSDFVSWFEGEDGAAFRNVDLHFTIVQSYLDGVAIADLSAVVRVEDVAHFLALGETGTNCEGLLSISVSERNQELASWEGVEVVGDVSFDVGLFPDLMGLPGVDNSSDEVVLVALGEGSPERFSVLRVVTTSIVLLTTVVDEGDSSGGQWEDKSGPESLLVVVGVQESSVVVVVNEDTKGINVIEFRFLLGVPVSDAVHAPATAPDVLDSEVHGVVEKAGNVVLVVTHIVGITVEDFSETEYSSSLGVLTPKVFWHFGNSINSDTVQVVLLHNTLDPPFKIFSNVGVLLSEIGQVSQSAVLHLLLVAPIIDLAVWVVVLGFV